MNLFLFFFNIIILFLIFITCYGKENKNNEVDLTVASNSLKEFIDTKHKPCDNFYNFSCGKWIDKKNSSIEVRNYDIFVYDLILGKYCNDSKVLKNLSKLHELCLHFDDYNKVSKCLFEVDNFSTYAYTSLYINHLEKKNQVEKNFKLVKQMTEYMKDSLKYLINRKSFLDSKTKKNYNKKIDNLKLYRKHHETLKDIKLMERCYKYFNFDKKQDYKTLIENIKKYSSFVKTKDKKVKQMCIEFVVKRKSENIPFSLLIEDNAFYDPRRNRLTVNPALFEDPYYDSRFPLSLSYGSLGFAIAHELIHALDYVNINVDSKGNKASYMTSKKSKENIDKKVSCFLEQHNIKHNSSSTLKFDELFVLNEDIADSGGINLAYIAYTKHMKDKKKDKITIPGYETFTGDQLFSLNFGRFICKNQDKRNRQLILSNDERKLDIEKIQMVLGSYEPFAKAFNCKKENKMINKKKCELW